jgi:formamidopyrimidine-DNA glycosylase
VHPQTKADNLSANQIEATLLAAKEIMEKSLAVGGTSFDALYVDVNGESGSNSENLKVYGQVNQPCPRCGALVERITFMNRSSHLCPVCQVFSKG